jgi:hypothetical protein
MMRTLALACLAACSFPEKHLATGDANGSGGRDGSMDSVLVDVAPFGCENMPLPTTAPATIAIHGLIVDDTGQNAVAGATVVIHDPAGAMIGQATTTDANGQYSISITTGGVPVDGHVNVMATNYVETTNYQAAPFAADTDVSFALITAADEGTLGNNAGVNFNPADAEVVVFVTDCDHRPQVGAMVPNPQAGATERYLMGNTYPATATSTDSSGQVLFVNIAPGSVTFQGTLSDSTAELARTINANAGQFIYVGLQPAPK